MDWIERVFHVDPDGGSGSTEILLMVGLALAVLSTALVVLRKIRKRRERKPMGSSIPPLEVAPVAEEQLGLPSDARSTRAPEARLFPDP